jgi:hypothetical protein
MMSRIRGVRFARKLLDDVSQQVVLGVPVFPRDTRREVQRTIAKRLNLFLCCVRRSSTFVEIFPFVLRETSDVGKKLMDRHPLPRWRAFRVVLADRILDVQFAGVG